MPVDIDRATPEELDAVASLKGHGPEIVRYREQRRGFTELRQLDGAPGLTGKLTEEALRELSSSLPEPRHAGLDPASTCSSQERNGKVDPGSSPG